MFRIIEISKVDLTAHEYHRKCVSFFFFFKESPLCETVLKTAPEGKQKEMENALSAAVLYQQEFLLCWWCSGEAQGQRETQLSLIHYQHVR